VTLALGRTAARSLLTSGVLAVWLLGVFGMWRGWRARGRRTVVPPLPSIAQPAGTDLVAPLLGVYLGTTIGGHWLERVTSRHLGERSAGHLRALPSGVAVRRRGYDDLFVPATDLAGIRLDRAHAGKVVAGKGILVLSWRHGGRVLETGFRAHDPHRHQELVDAISGMIRETGAQAVQPTREFT
jgi:carbamoyl-phosphate synthase small subunit